MKKQTNYIWLTRKAATAAMLALSITFWSGGVAFAVGPIVPTGPQGSVGNIAPVGPQGETGPRVETGPKGSSGNVQSEEKAEEGSSGDDTQPNEDLAQGDTAESSDPVEKSAVVTSDSGTATLSGVGGPAAGDTAMAVNSNTGPSSTNKVTSNDSASSKTLVSNNANDSTAVVGSLSTGSNTSSSNTGEASIKTGNTNVGVTQVKQDNTVVKDGNVGLQVQGSQGTHKGDLAIDFEKAISLLTGDGQARSVKATNESTGPNSENEVVLRTKMEDITEVQNDGVINNDVDVEAVTGNNKANNNTGGASIETGNANVSATLVNLLNSTVVNGNLAVSVYDIFGDLLGNVSLPDLEQLASILNGDNIRVEAENEETGPDSENTIDVNIAKNEETKVNNAADVNTEVNAKAVTGQNNTMQNTSGGSVETGDASVQASNTSIANTTVEGGNWALVIVNSLNRWAGVLFGDSGEVKVLTQDETIKEIEARNANTGPGSDNSIIIDDQENRTVTVNNDATINNTVNAMANTGDNAANYNTGAGSIKTGNANILASAVNIANVTVKDANLGIAIVNVFGNWFGDLLYGGKSLLVGVGGDPQVVASNQATGSNSTNAINVNVDSNKETHINNDADVSTILNATVDTGNNRSSSNTLGGNVKTGLAMLGLHSRTAANITGVSDSAGVTVTEVNGTNDTTGSSSQNRINANVNNNRVLVVDNNANVTNEFSATANTGNNEVAHNTIGGSIDTGDIVARTIIDQLVNRVLAALHGSGVVVAAALTNSNTGSDSDNSNLVNIDNNSLLDILNNATIANIINLLFNTGGNTLAYNTVGGGITTGSICVDGHVNTVVNDVDGMGWNDTMIHNVADVANLFSGKGSTGDNALNHNTTAGDATQSDGCEKYQPQKPTPTPSPGGGGNGDGGGDGGSGDDNGAGGGVVEEDQDGNGGDKGSVAGAREDRRPRIAQAIAPMTEAAQALAATGANALLPRRDTSPWVLFGIFSSLLLAGTMYQDQRSRMVA